MKNLDTFSDQISDMWNPTILPKAFVMSTICREYRYFASQETCLCLGSLSEVWVAGVYVQLLVPAAHLQGVTLWKCRKWKRWKEIRGKAKGTKREAQGTHFRSEEHIPQCGVICVHLHVNEGQSVRLAVVILGRIFWMAGTCSLISSFCYGACSWGGNCLL